MYKHHGCATDSRIEPPPQGSMPPTTLAHLPISAVPAFYYIVFGVIEPLLAFASLVEAIIDPGKVMNRRGLWPGVFMKTPGVPSTAAHEIVGQMVLTHAIIGFIGASVFRAIRRLPSSALQEKIAKSLFVPLAIGDVTYLLGIFYGIGDVRWKLNDWPQTLWLSVIVGIGFFIPRVCWLLGIGRYVATRDSRLDCKN